MYAKVCFGSSAITAVNSAIAASKSPSLRATNPLEYAESVGICGTEFGRGAAEEVVCVADRGKEGLVAGGAAICGPKSDRGEAEEVCVADGGKEGVVLVSGGDGPDVTYAR